MRYLKLLNGKGYYFYISIITTALFLAAIFLRMQVVFAYDQARDAFEAYNIWHNKDIKILGPSTDIPGVYHGALWYYLLAIPYTLGEGDPQFVAQFFFILSFLTVPLCGYVALKIFNNTHIALLSMALYALSPLFQATTRWLSNPIISLYITPPLLLCLWRYFNKQEKIMSFISGILFGLLIQSNFSFGLFIFTLPIYLLVYKINIRIKDIMLFSGGFLLALSTYIAAEIKFQGRMIKTMMQFLDSNNTIAQSVGGKLVVFGDKIINLLSITILPLPKLLITSIFVLSLFLLIKAVKSKEGKRPLSFLLIWLSNILFFQFFNSGAVQSSHIFIPSLIPIIMLTSFILVKSLKSTYLYLVLLIFIFAAQVYTSYSWARNNFSPLSVQNGMFLYKEKELIDYTYKASSNNTFSIVSITSPLYINTTWAYLYQFYGAKKYGYAPYWSGRNQEGYLGNLQAKNFGTKYNYLIIESTVGIYDIYVAKIIYDQDNISDLLEEKKFGELRVQKREFHPGKAPVAIPKILLNSHLLYE